VHQVGYYQEFVTRCKILKNIKILKKNDGWYSEYDFVV